MRHDLNMRLNLDFEPSLGAIMRAEIEAGERAVTAAMREAGGELKMAWRLQIKQAGIGGKLDQTVRDRTYPKSGESLHAAALVWTKAPVIMNAHETGPLIRAKHGHFLAIPLPAAGKLRGGKSFTPREWEMRRGMKLRFVSRRKYGKPPLLVADGRLNNRGIGVVARSKKHGPLTGRNRATVPIFVLVPQVKLRKRLDLGRLARQAADRVPGLIAAKWREMD